MPEGCGAFCHLHLNRLVLDRMHIHTMLDYVDRCAKDEHAAFMRARLQQRGSVPCAWFDSWVGAAYRILRQARLVLMFPDCTVPNLPQSSTRKGPARALVAPWCQVFRKKRLGKLDCLMIQNLMVRLNFRDVHLVRVSCRLLLAKPGVLAGR
jgi:hypothetical protein